MAEKTAPPRITEKQLEVLRLAKDGHSLYTNCQTSQSARTAVISRLNARGYIDGWGVLTIEGARVLAEQSR